MAISNERVDASQRGKQIVALQGIHRVISDEWGDHYYSVINAVEAALSAMTEAEDAIDRAKVETL